MALLVKRLSGSQGAGIGVAGTFLILLCGVGVWFAIHRVKKRQLLKKIQSASSIEAATTSVTATATTTKLHDWTAPRNNAAASALEMGTAEGNTHQLSTRDNAHELDCPDRPHEMGDLAPEYGAQGGIHLEGDVGAADGQGPHEREDEDEDEIYPQGDHGKYDNDGAGAKPGGGHAHADGKERGGLAKPMAELEGDVAFRHPPAGAGGGVVEHGVGDAGAMAPAAATAAAVRERSRESKERESVFTD